METGPGHKIIQNPPPLSAISATNYQKIRDYYDIAGPDYACWSRNFNMHFGYCRKFTDIFFLEKMLMNMNEQVMNRLQLSPGKQNELVDLGCGVGTVARYISRRFPQSRITGVTISDYQVDKAKQLSRQEGLENTILIQKNNFECLDFPDESFTHAYAVESACHASGSGKELFISEMARVLEKGGRFCMADGFLKHDRKLPGFFNYLYKKILGYWALPCFGNINEVKMNLLKAGFTGIEIREASWRIAPSVCYVPWTCLKFFVKEIWKNKSLRMKKERWHNVYAPVLAMILGLYRRQFGYYIISGKKA